MNNEELFSKILEQPVYSVERIFNGRNSQIYKINEEYAGKIYFQHSSDNRDRLNVEFLSFKFLWDNGIRNIPKPIKTDKQNNCAVYQYINGSKILPNQITVKDVEVASEFILEINKLKTQKEASNLPVASEAFFSPEEIIANIQNRYERLKKVEKKGQQYNLLEEFLTDIFVPFFEEIKEKIKASGNYELPQEERILSPSDFGFHNALKEGNGRIVFLDFEYFGWDDPAKLVCDFALHPAMNLEKELGDQFAKKIVYELKQENLKERINLFYPLFGLKWCTIFLNEFVPEYLSRRKFAIENLDIKKIQLDQLKNAQNMLHKLKNEGNI